ncbi:MAG TPA: alkaline phosphatase family protein [Bryobacteraceae bacterium]|nr:alkaline phosphatase family protein [Bryobacteraceae bacterium]
MRTRPTAILLFIAILLTAPFLAAAPKPKLVLAIVIDQFRYDYLLRFRADYNSGFVQLLDHGAFFSNAHYLHATTVTAAGHSTFLSGATPSISGIIANEWFDRATGKNVTSVSDPATRMVPGDGPGSSPRRLLVSTVGDEVRMQGGDSEVIGVSIKDRSAILPAGHMADGAYWYDDPSGQWVTSTYYRPSLPAWAEAVNEQQPGKKYANAKWLPFDARSDSAKPFCTMTRGTSVRYCGSIEATPWGNEMIEQFAEAALTGENLGHHSGTDILTVSFSSNDYVGHAVGPDDPAVRDISIRTDRLLGKFLNFVDAHVGAANTLVVLTADHGVAPVPEVNEARHMPGGRIKPAELMEKINTALADRFGAGKWLLANSPTMPYLNLPLIAEHKLDPAEVERVAAAAALTEAHIARAYTRHDILAGQMQQDPISRAVSLTFFGPRSGDLYIVQDPYYLFDATGTSHGTPYNYDTHVPIIFLGPGIKPGIYRQSVAPNDIAPTLAQILGVQEPSGSIGHVLAEMLQ